ncbi:serine protease [Flavobacterium amniphilum]|uniref:S1 family peptidase n=1 Tax=Flavobacterium amniphilum TaxID=1834035 RepID=UPI00202ABD91|nr:serine protease [Flavobacterium amniphilum]MCL9804602.1 serine protease [Flavobacterium amniphilum]
MSSITHEIIGSNIDLAKIVINFFTAEQTNPELFKQIKEICISKSNHFNKLNGESYIESGFLSLFDFSQYMSYTKLNGGGYKIYQVELLVNKLVENHIISPLPELLTVNHSNERRFKSGSNLTQFLYERDLILNVVCGWNYIINKYSNSVVKIEHKAHNGDCSIGTGFYYSTGDNSTRKSLIITNKHVVEKAMQIKVFLKDDTELKYLTIKQDSDRDLAFIELEQYLPISTFHLNPSTEILSEIITIGYPSIPMTKFAYQLIHKGEVNTYVEDYFDNKLFLFSAKTSSGNSGSPIIDRYGMVVGIVTEELFEKDQFYSKGKLPYYAGIPSDEIIKSANKNVFHK